MDDQQIIAGFNAHAPGFFDMLGGSVVAVDREQHACTIEFNISRDFCHSIDVIQGGFITAMLDAAMSHAAYVKDSNITSISSLEIKTSYLEPTRAGRLRAVGRVIKAGYKLAFMEGSLYDDKGLLTATSSSVGKLSRAS